MTKFPKIILYKIECENWKTNNWINNSLWVIKGHNNDTNFTRVLTILRLPNSNFIFYLKYTQRNVFNILVAWFPTNYGHVVYIIFHQNKTHTHWIQQKFLALSEKWNALAHIFSEMVFLLGLLFSIQNSL